MSMHSVNLGTHWEQKNDGISIEGDHFIYDSWVMTDHSYFSSKGRFVVIGVTGNTVTLIKYIDVIQNLMYLGDTTTYGGFSIKEKNIDVHKQNKKIVTLNILKFLECFDLVAEPIIDQS